VRQLTQNLSPDLDPANLVDAQVVRYPSYDGVQVPALLYRPRQVGGQDHAPAVLWIHGGPGGQSRVGYSAFTQYLANHGYVVLAVNNRGSSGYGKAFGKLDDKRHTSIPPASPLRVAVTAATSRSRG
jgi:dipeptidyl aminopeptidase/acylaminoacyl peptidase